MSLKNIARALEELDTLYNDQINAFDEEALPDLEGQSAERNASLTRLKKIIDEMLGSMGDRQTLENRPDLEEILGHIQILLHRNSALKDRVLETKEQLQQSMSRITAGKRAINAYGSPQSVRNRPKVLTVRN